jgi:hypothetical protein
MISNQNFVPFLASNPYHTEMIYGSFGHDIVGHLLRWLMIPTHDVMNRFEASFHFLHVIFSPSGNVDAREKLASKSTVSLPATRQNWMKVKPKPKPKPKPKSKLTRTRGQGSRECWTGPEIELSSAFRSVGGTGRPTLGVPTRLMPKMERTDASLRTRTLQTGQKIFPCRSPLLESPQMNGPRSSLADLQCCNGVQRLNSKRHPKP